MRRRPPPDPCGEVVVQLHSRGLTPVDSGGEHGLTLWQRRGLSVAVGRPPDAGAGGFRSGSPVTGSPG